MIQGSQGATALVGMAGFVVGVQELVEGEWWLYVETSADFVGCSACGTRAVGHGRVRSVVRDLPISGRATVLVFARRRWRCPEPACAVTTWSEQVDQISARVSITKRARQRLAAMVNVEGMSIAAAAAEFGVGWHTANRAVAEFTDPVIKDPGRLDGVASIGVDEKRFLNATADHRTTFTTQVLDLDRHRVLDVLEGRSRDVLGDWLTDRGDTWCAGITLATLDPAAGYRAALVEHLPNATLVVDHFHAVKLANTAIDDVRRRVQHATLGHRGRKGDPLYRARRVLLTGFERLTEERITWMLDMLAAGDPDGEVGAAVLAKELLREVYAAVDHAHAQRRLTAFFQHCADADVAELVRLARTIDRWRDEILSYHRTGRASNGRVENAHMLAEKIRRNAHGFTNHTNYRRRLIGRLGIQWTTVPTRRIRGRQPHLIA
ncbi:ISL3 family transposase [Rhabdothermincola sediminis]|uniref:ISL3 family transposase n=1 Tax=Rhabdothermincola sediminis TaxID=2751370 RepID=UPI001AA07B00|nr:ISL3 family transposase [Rhabdothermincola sediminis]